jgi:Fe-S oxidoreductase
MIPGADTNELAKRALLFEEFLAQEQDSGKLKIPLKPLTATHALVHGHCHQKAFDTLGDLEKTLNLLPGLEFQTLSSGCCGMAGAFGYDADNYDISMKMAEESLLPAVRKAATAQGDIILVAGGTSCRHQIKDGTGCKAVHIARLIESALIVD